MIKDAFEKQETYYIVVDGNTDDYKYLYDKCSYFSNVYTWIDSPTLDDPLIDGGRIMCSKERMAKMMTAVGGRLLTTNAAVGISTKLVVDPRGDLRTICMRTRIRGGL